jgi:glycosyltransferase involved in cell wall biosynthesis
MIHFFPRFSKSAEDAPFGQLLRKMEVPHRIFAAFVPQTYTYRFQLLLIGYPKLAWAALIAAVKSLLGSRKQAPDAVVVSSDVEVLIFALVRRLPFAAKPRIVLIPFIFTMRRSPAVNRARLLYYRFVMRRVSLAICHSRLEIGSYRAVFGRCGTEFVFLPWGGHVPPAAEVLSKMGPLPAAEGAPRLVSAGRSGRDYPTLVKAVETIPCRLRIICNEKVSLGGVAESNRIEILRDCFGLEYLWQLLRADIVVIPLRVADISAGQMVLIQAMALARPLIVTRTPTVEDYLTDGVNALLVPRGDAAAMAGAIQRLLADPAEAAALSRRAQADYMARFSAEAHFRALVQAVEQHCGLPKSAAALDGSGWPRADRA